MICVIFQFLKAVTDSDYQKGCVCISCIQFQYQPIKCSVKYFWFHYLQSAWRRHSNVLFYFFSDLLYFYFGNFTLPVCYGPVDYCHRCLTRCLLFYAALPSLYPSSTYMTSGRNVCTSGYGTSNKILFFEVKQ